MKIKYFLSYTILFICIAFSYTEDFINSTLKQSQVENYSSLTLDSEHAFEGPVDPQKYKVGVGDQFLFSMIYPFFSKKFFLYFIFNLSYYPGRLDFIPIIN